MNSRVLLGLAIAVAVGISALAYVDRTLAQPVAQTPMGPGGQMMGPGQQMPTGQMMGQMMGQMQQQMTRMTANLQAMRVQLDKINPDLLTANERPMYEYLKLLQAQMGMMQGWMGMAQGVMRQTPGMGR